MRADIKIKKDKMGFSR